MQAKETAALRSEDLFALTVAASTLAESRLARYPDDAIIVAHYSRLLDIARRVERAVIENPRVGVV